MREPSGIDGLNGMIEIIDSAQSQSGTYIGSVRFIKPILKVAVAIFLVILPFSIPTIIGVGTGFVPWQEDKFVGKPLAELRTFLEKSGRQLTADPGNRNSYYFEKGNDFSVVYGTARNFGRVKVNVYDGVEVIREVEHSSRVATSL